MVRKAMLKSEFSQQQYGSKLFAPKYHELIQNPAAIIALQEAKYKKRSKMITPGQQEVFIRFLG